MNEQEKKRELLYASFDRELSPDEKNRLDEYLTDPGLKEEKEELEEMRHLLGKTSWHFDAGFSSRVMERIQEEKEETRVVEMESTGQFFSFFRKIAVASVAAIVILLISIYLTSGTINKETVLGMDNFTEDNLVSYLLEDFTE